MRALSSAARFEQGASPMGVYRETVEQRRE